jgi:hypothetical protein
VATLDSNVILDDRLLIEAVLADLAVEGRRHTTFCWYYRACRAAVAGAGGHLSGPFLGLDAERQAAAIRSLLVLPRAIGLPDPRSTVPVMAELSERHPRLNLLNLEAAGTGLLLEATVLLSVEASRGVLPGVLDAERIEWRVVDGDLTGI